MRRFPLVALAVLLLVPAIARAEQTTTWDFRMLQVPGEWDVSGWATVKPDVPGLHIQSPVEGRMFREYTFPQSMETVRFVFLQAQTTDAMFLWRPRSATEPNVYVQLPFTLEPDQNGRAIAEFDMNAFPEWDGRIGRIGFALDANSDTYLQEISFGYWGLGEKLAEAWKSFWVFDEIHAYSINFLWGPLITLNPVGYSHLFTTLPPNGWSINRFLYVLLGLIAAATLLHWLIAGRRSRSVTLKPFGTFPLHTGLFLLCIGIAWVGYDLRMTAEQLSYVQKDWKTWITATPGERTLRDIGNLLDITLVSLPALKEQPRYGLLLPPGANVGPMVRYHTYPSLPAGPHDDLSAVKTWFVFERGDIVENTKGELVIDGKPLTPPGTVLRRFNERSFIFHTAP